jgi:hypothetical protein
MRRSKLEGLELLSDPLQLHHPVSRILDGLALAPAQIGAREVGGMVVLATGGREVLERVREFEALHRRAGPRFVRYGNTPWLGGRDRSFEPCGDLAGADDLVAGSFHAGPGAPPRRPARLVRGSTIELCRGLQSLRGALIRFILDRSVGFPEHELGGAPSSGRIAGRADLLGFAARLRGLSAQRVNPCPLALPRLVEPIADLPQGIARTTVLGQHLHHGFELPSRRFELPLPQQLHASRDLRLERLCVGEHAAVTLDRGGQLLLEQSQCGEVRVIGQRWPDLSVAASGLLDHLGMQSLGLG